MAKGTKLSEFEKGEITTLKRFGKSEWEILKVLGRSKTIICHYLKSPNKYVTRKQEKLLPQFKRRIVCKLKKTSSTSKILKSLVDVPCSIRTIRRHLNNEKIKHKKRIHHPRLTMKHKEKWLEYGCQYQTIVTYWPSAELSNKRCTCVNNRCIWSKISGYHLDCGWVELCADVTPTRSRWASNNYTTGCHRQFQLVGDRCCCENQLPERAGLSEPSVEQPSRMRKKCC